MTPLQRCVLFIFGDIVMSEVLAFYMYPEPKGTYYFKKDFFNPDRVIEIFDYCQLWLAIITKAGWDFLISHYGYERLFELNNESGWIDCLSIDEYKSEIEYEISIAEGRVL